MNNQGFTFFSMMSKFFASFIYTVLLLVFMAALALGLSLLIFGSGDLLIFRVRGEESLIMQLSKDDILWRYFAAFVYAAIALTVNLSVAVRLLIFMFTAPFGINEIPFSLVTFNLLGFL